MPTLRATRRETTMSYECPRCGARLVETDDEVNDFELEGAQVRHTVKRCAEVERAAADMRLEWNQGYDESDEE